MQHRGTEFSDSQYRQLVEDINPPLIRRDLLGDAVAPQTHLVDSDDVLVGADWAATVLDMHLGDDLMIGVYFPNEASLAAGAHDEHSTYPSIRFRVEALPNLNTVGQLRVRPMLDRGHLFTGLAVTTYNELAGTLSSGPADSAHDNFSLLLMDLTLRETVPSQLREELQNRWSEMPTVQRDYELLREYLDESEQQILDDYIWFAEAYYKLFNRKVQAVFGIPADVLELVMSARMEAFQTTTLDRLEALAKGKRWEFVSEEPKVATRFMEIIQKV